MRKSQSALEYMMTYGWAILIIVIVAAVLYSLGIFSPSSSLAPTTITGFGGGVKVLSVTANASIMELQLSDQLGYAVNITNITVTSTSNGRSSSKFVCIDDFLSNGASTECLVSGLSLPNPASTTILVDFTSRQGISSQTFVSSGTVRTQLVSLSIPQTTFSESGLPSDTNWTVTYGGSSHSSTSSSIFVSIIPGTYSFTISSPAFSGSGCTAVYSPSPSSGSLHSGSSQDVSFSEGASSCVTTFTESGLSPDTLWTVVYDGVSNSSTTDSITVHTAEGSFSYSVSTPSSPAPSSGCTSEDALIPVSGSATAGSSKAETFEPESVCTTAFTESGLPSGMEWTANFNGSSNSSTGNTIKVTTLGGSSLFTASQESNSSSDMTSIWTSNDTLGTSVVAGSDATTQYYSALYSKNVFIDSLSTGGVQGFNTSLMSTYFSTDVGGQGWPYNAFPESLASSPNGEYLYEEQGSVTYYSDFFVLNASNGNVIGAYSLSYLPVFDRGLPYQQPMVVTRNGEMVFAYSVGSYLYAVNVSNPASLTVTSISGFSEPSDAVLSHNGKELYVTNYASNTVSVLNITSLAVIETMAVGYNPVTIAITPNGDYAYVTAISTPSIAVLNLTDGVNVNIANISVGQGTEGIEITPDGKLAYVIGEGDSNVVVINTTSNSVVEDVAVGTSPQEITIAPDEKNAYVTNLASDTVSVIGIPSNSVVATIDLSDNANPQGIAVSANSDYLYVADYGNNTLSLINTSSNQLIKTIYGFGGSLDLLTATNSGAYIEAGNYQGYTSFINASSLSITSIIPEVSGLNCYSCSLDADDMSISPNNKFLYISNAQGYDIEVINTSSNKEQSVFSATYPAWSASNDKYLFTSSTDYDTLTVENATTGSYIKEINAGYYLNSGTFTHSGGYLFMTGDSNLLINDSTTQPTEVEMVPSVGQSSVISPNGDVLYTLDEYSKTVSAINTSTNMPLSTFDINNSGVGAGPTDFMAISGNGEELCVVASSGFAVINVSNPASMTLVYNESYSNIQLCALTPNNKYVLLTTAYDFVNVVNLSSSPVTSKTLPLSGPDYGLAISPTGNYAVVDGYGSGSNITVINLTSMAEAANISAGLGRPGTSPYEGDTVITPDGKYVYAGEWYGYYEGIYVFNLSSMSFLEEGVINDGYSGGSSTNSLALSSDGEYLYVANFVPGYYASISVINASPSNIGLITSINLPSSISQTPSLSLSKNNKYLYVLYGNYENISVINVSVGYDPQIIDTINSVPYPEHISAGLNNVYVQTESSPALYVINATGALLSQVYGVPSGSYTTAIFSSNDKYAYVSANGRCDLSIINMTKLLSNVKNPLSAISGINSLCNTTLVGTEALTPNNDYLYVPTANSVAVVDTTNEALVKNISMSWETPYEIEMNPDGKSAYVSVQSSTNTISVINISSMAVSKNITVGYEPEKMALAPNGKLLYVMNLQNSTVSVINTTTNNVVATISGSFFAPSQLYNMIFP